METLTATPNVKPTVPDVRFIPLDKIQPSSHQARKDFDEEGIKGLAESMKAEGQIQVIAVREKGDGFELISGERRLRAAKLLGWETIEAKVIKTASEVEAAVKGMVENLQRQELNPIEEAEGFQEISQLDPGLTQGRIAQVSGKTQGYISQSLKLLNLPEQVCNSIRRLIISRSHGLELCRLAGDDQQIDAAKQIESKKLSVEQTRRLVDDLLKKPSLPPTQAAKPAASPDPLAALWPLMKSNPSLKQENWKERYHGGGQWAFSVTVAAATPGPDLARWFRLMESALMEAIAHTDGRDTLDSLIPKTRKELEQAMPDIKRLSLPDGSGEEARLRKAGELLGPEEVFKQVFGTDSLYYRKVKGKTWKDLGCSDPTAAVQKLVDGVRKVS